MVKKLTLSLLALIPFRYTTGYVIPSISHSSRFICFTEDDRVQLLLPARGAALRRILLSILYIYIYI